MSAYELFHEIVGVPNIRVRREIVARGLKPRIDFRNIHYDEHRDAFAARGGSRTPALWNGERLHEGEDAVMTRLQRIAADPGR